MSAPDLLVVPTDKSAASVVSAGGNDPIESGGGSASVDVSANVTVETSTSNTTQQQQQQQQMTKRQMLQQVNCLNVSVPHDILLGRWRLALDLFGRVFVDDVGLEPGSIISELGGFPVKEAKFRREMEKLRNSRSVDLTITKIERERDLLIFQAFKELNSHYQNQVSEKHSKMVDRTAKVNSPVFYFFQRRSNSSQPPLVVNRVKVTFLNEPGEGSGVARSFYTALSEALLSSQKLPSLEGAQVGSSKSMQFNLIRRLRSKPDHRIQSNNNPAPSRMVKIQTDSLAACGSFYLIFVGFLCLFPGARESRLDRRSSSSGGAGAGGGSGSGGHHHKSSSSSSAAAGSRVSRDAQRNLSIEARPFYLNGKKRKSDIAIFL